MVKVIHIHGWMVVQVMTDPDLVRFVSRMGAFAVYALFGTSFLGTVGIDTKPFVATIGVSGFLVGFALKEVGPPTSSHHDQCALIYKEG